MVYIVSLPDIAKSSSGTAIDGLEASCALSCIKAAVFVLTRGKCIGLFDIELVSVTSGTLGDSNFLLLLYHLSFHL